MLKLLIAVVLVLPLHALAASPAAPPGPAVTAPKPQPGSLEEAILALDSWSGQHEQLDRARNNIDRLLRENPRNHRALRERARLEIMAGYVRDRCVDFNGHCYSIGVFRPGTLESAESTLKEALAIDPNYAEAYVLLGHVYQQGEKVQEAAAALRKAEELGTEDPWLHLNWADLHEMRGETALATERWRKVLDKGTANRKAMNAAYGHLITHYRREKQYDLAIATYRLMIANDPANAWHRGNFADMLGRMGRHDEAIEEARAALRVMEYGMAYRTLSWNLYSKWGLLISEGKRAEAGPYFDEAYGIRPDLKGVMVEAAPHASSLPVARALVKEKGVSIDIPDKEGSTPLLIAVNTNRTDVVRELLALGANPNVTDPAGWTPLISAADEGNGEIVKLLLDAGADRNARMRNKTAEVQAIFKNHPLIAKQIRDYKPAAAAPKKR
jgi:tetratricopeptide (TPR) repeat protein